MDSRTTQILLGIIAVAMVALVVLLAIVMLGISPSIDVARETPDGIDVETVYYDVRYLEDLVHAMIESNNTQWDMLGDVQGELLTINGRLDDLAPAGP